MWICLFTCLAVRAVHLEDYQPHCFWIVLKDLCKPRLVISDNAPQFRLVKTILEQNVSK